MDRPARGFWRLYTVKLEIFDKRHAVSNQESLFHVGVRLAMEQFDKFASTSGSREQVETAFDNFVDLLLQIAAETFSLGRRVDAGLMVKIPQRDRLKLVKWSNHAKYDEQLEIPIPAGQDCSKSGPAGVAFAKNCLVYVPRKGRKKPKRVWPFAQDEGNPHSFVPLDSQSCWISAKAPELEKFSSVICAPIGGLGVLNFSTSRRDPFIYRDFLMAQYFARTLAEASLLRRQKLA